MHGGRHAARSRVAGLCLAAWAAGGLAAGADAGAPGLDQGLHATLGPVAAAGRPSGRAGNPAAAGLSGPGLALEALGAPTAMYEFGPAGYPAGDIDRLREIADTDGVSRAEAEDRVAEANAILDRLGDTAYALAQGNASVPGTPLHVRIPTARGHAGFGLDINGQGAGQVEVLDDDFAVSGDGPDDVSIATDTAGYIKTAGVATVSASYGQAVLGDGSGTSLALGLRLKYYEAWLAKSVLAFDLGKESGSDLAALAGSELARNRRNTRTWGLDLGALGQVRLPGATARLGLALADVNRPRLDYPALGEDCARLAGADARANCRTARSFSGRIALAETATLGPRVRTSAALAGRKRPWRLAASVDAIAVRDALGRRYQWLTLGAGYDLPGRFAPAGRFGYRRNLAGSGLGYITGGLSLADAWHLDIATTVETVTVDKTEVARSFVATTGYSLVF